MIQEHNKIFNPSARTGKSRAKRPPPSDDDYTVYAIHVTPRAGQNTLEELKAKNASEFSELPSAKLIACEGEMFLLGLTDDVITDVNPLCRLTVTFAVNMTYQQRETSILYQLNADSMVTAKVITKSPLAIPKTPLPLGTLLEALHSHGLTNLNLYSHELQRLDGGKWNVFGIDNIIYLNNARSLLHSGKVGPRLSLAGIDSSPYVRLVHTLTFNENDKSSRIGTCVPAVHFKVPVQIKKDELIQLTWKRDWEYFD